MSDHGELKRRAEEILEIERVHPCGSTRVILVNPATVLALIAEVEALRKEIAALKPSPIRTDKTTIGYTGCIICGKYTDHGGLQCPNLAARSLSIENQRVMPVEPIRAEHPLDTLDRKLKP